jgi:chaperonin GroEL
LIKDVLYGMQARVAIAAGVSKTTDTVRATLGPKGRGVCYLPLYDVPRLATKGFELASAISLEDPFENMGASLAQQAAASVKLGVGDGTTTTLILADTIIKEGIRNIAAGVNPVLLRRGLEAARKVVLATLEREALPLDPGQIRQIVFTASGNDAVISDMVSTTYKGIGINGSIFIEDSQQAETTIVSTSGMLFDNGYLSPYFVNDTKKMAAVIEAPLMLVCEDVINDFKDMQPLLSEVKSAGASLLIIAKEVKGDALKGLSINAVKGVLKVAAVSCPGYGEKRELNFRSIAALCGAIVVGERTGAPLKECGMEVCGSAGKAVISKNNTIIQDFPGVESDGVKALRGQLAKRISKTKKDFEKEKLEESLSYLSGGMAIIKAGGVSEIEMFYQKSKLEDSVNAVRAAAEGGILPGGGIAYTMSVPELALLAVQLQGDEKIGALILQNALSAPLKQMAKNAHLDGDIILGNIRESKTNNLGYDFLKMEYSDLLEAGIIDPAKLVKTVIEVSTSMAAEILTVDVCIAGRVTSRSGKEMT